MLPSELDLAAPYIKSTFIQQPTADNSICPFQKKELTALNQLNLKKYLRNLVETKDHPRGGLL